MSCPCLGSEEICSLQSIPSVSSSHPCLNHGSGLTDNACPPSGTAAHSWIEPPEKYDIFGDGQNTVQALDGIVLSGRPGLVEIGV